MFSLKNFVKNGLMLAVGQMEDYKIILNAAEWNGKGVLNETDLEEIQNAIDKRNSFEEQLAAGEVGE